MQNEEIFINNKEPIKYSTSDLNIIVSLILAEIATEGRASESKCEFAKSVFNDVMRIIVEEKETADEMINFGNGLTNAMLDADRDTEEDEAWDIISAAEKIRDDTLIS